MGKGDDDQVHDAAPPPKKSNAVLIIGIVAALVLGGLCLTAVLATLLMPALLKAKAKANRTKCANNLRQIALGALQYSDDLRSFPFVEHDPTGAKAMKLLVDKGYIDDPEVFLCPCDPAGPGYVGFQHPASSNVASTFPIAWEATSRFGGRNVVFADGHCEFVGDADFPMVEEYARTGVRPPG